MEGYGNTESWKLARKLKIIKTENKITINAYFCFMYIIMYQSTLLFLNIGAQETIVIVFAILLLFGGKKLPELARGLGKGIREFKDASDDVKREIHRNINSLTAEEELRQEEQAERKRLEAGEEENKTVD